MKAILEYGKNANVKTVTFFRVTKSLDLVLGKPVKDHVKKLRN